MRRRILTIIGGMGVLGCSICGAFVPVRVSAYSTTEFMLSNSATPTISISMNQPIVGDGNLDQIEGLPSSASFYKPIEISAGSIKSYYVSVYLDCSNLSGNDKTKCESGNLLTSSGDTLKSVDSAKTFGTMSNEWGFRYNLGDSAQDPSDKYFAPLPTNKVNGYLQYNGAEQIRTDASTNNDNKTLTLGFGAKVDGNTAAGTYNGKIAVAVVATPSEIAVPAFGGVTTMQAMNHSICASAGVHDTAYLKDERDNKYYWVTKLEDGHCWMSQNLDLDVGVSGSNNTASNTGMILDSTNTDIASGNVTGLKATSNNIQDGVNVNAGDMSKHSWDQGLWAIKDPMINNSCSSSNKTGISACTTQFTDVSGSEWRVAEDPNFTNLNTYQQGGATYTKIAGSPLDEENRVYDAHYLIGNYYQFNAATVSSATSGNTNLTLSGDPYNGNAPDSLCPKGWKLPSSNTMDDVAGRSSYPYMSSRYGLSTDVNTGQVSGVLNGKVTDVALSPLFYVRSGNINSGAKVFYGIGYVGTYWSARVTSNADEAHIFEFYGMNPTLRASYTQNRVRGLPVRCVMY